MDIVSNVLLSMAEVKDLHNNTAMELNLGFTVQNPSTIDAVEEEITTAKVKPSLGGLDAVADEDNEGFKTPPLPQNRIRTLKECPPAPKKARDHVTTLRSPWKKRKLSVMSPRARVLLDYSNEVEAMFPLAIRSNFYGKLRKVGGHDQNSLCPHK